MERVQKIISNAGYASRRAAETLITQGRVSVNGKTITLGDKASASDDIRINGEPLERENKRYILFNKPIGYVTSMHDPHEKTIMELITLPERVYPVGRLDKDTRGLLILTNDGDLAHILMHPSHEIEKTYIATLDKPLSHAHEESISRGVLLEDGMSHPAKLARYAPARIQICIHEGRNRIVRRLFEHHGYRIMDLVRIRIGSIGLGDLREGTYRDLRPKEIKNLREEGFEPS